MINFIIGVLIASCIWSLVIRKDRKNHEEILKSIYYGYSAPDENGHVGHYRDNRHGSPFIDPSSPWSEAGISK